MSLVQKGTILFITGILTMLVASFVTAQQGIDSDYGPNRFSKSDAEKINSKGKDADMEEKTKEKTPKTTNSSVNRSLDERKKDKKDFRNEGKKKARGHMKSLRSLKKMFNRGDKRNASRAFDQGKHVSSKALD